MKSTRRPLAAALLAASLITSFTLSLPAAATPDAAPAPGPDAGVQDAPPGGPDSHGFGPGGRGPGPGMPFWRFHGLNLSEAQQDKVFNIMHAQAPQRREHEKAIRKAEEGLRALGRADRFDDARAAALSRDLGQAIAAAELLRVRTDAQLLAVLTPEQRATLRQRHEHGPGRAPGGNDGPGRADGPAQRGGE